MREEREVLVRELLERLEGEEAKLLTWGVVDGGFTADEVTGLAPIPFVLAQVITSCNLGSV